MDGTTVYTGAATQFDFLAFSISGPTWRPAWVADFDDFEFVSYTPDVSIKDVSVNEGNNGSTAAVFTVCLSAASNEVIAVPFATADGTATVADNDYQPLSGTLTFLPGETTKTINVLVNGDTKFEPDETFKLNLGTPTNATVVRAQAVGTIANDDPAPGLVLTVTPSLSEGDTATLNGTISNPPTRDFRVLVDWGEGVTQTLPLTARTTNFTATHTYRDDNPTNTPSDSYTVTAQVLTAAADVVGTATARFGSTGDDRITATTVDAAGNSYAVGTFLGTVDFDPGPGTTLLTAGSSRSPFLFKLDNVGNLAWAMKLDTWVLGNPTDVTVDPSGNVLAAVEWGSYYVLKFDAGGNLIWNRTVGASPGTGWNVHLAADATGNVLATGPFTGTVDFDAGPGVANLTSAGGTDVFVTKLGAAGNFLWAQRFGGAGPDEGGAVASGPGGRVVATGGFQGTVDFDPGPGIVTKTSAGDTDIFLVTLDPAGVFVRADAFGSAAYDSGYDLTFAPSGDLYVTGGFNATVDFDPGPATATLTSVGGVDGFIAKYTANGDTLWAKSVGAPQVGSGEIVEGVAVDAAGNVYGTGTYGNTVDFDPGPGTAPFTAVGFLDAFVLKLDSTGGYVWTASLGGSNLELSAGVAVGSDGAVLVAGSFWGTGDFDPGPGAATLASAGSADGFLVKLAQSAVLYTASAAVLVNDMAPSVNAGPDAIVRAGDPFAVTGSFTDPGVLDTFTATVNYGDGTGDLPLTLTPNRTFRLSHVYSRAGTYTVSVVVGDDDTRNSNDTVTISVLPPLLTSNFFADWNADGRPDLVSVRGTNTASGRTEVDILDAATNYQTILLHSATALHATDDTFAFDVADHNRDGRPDLIAIKKANSGSRTTEVHVLNGATLFQNFLLQTGTALHETGNNFDFQAVDFNRDGFLDLVAFKKSATGTNRTEVHVLNGATNYQNFLLQTGTGLHETGAEASLSLTDVNRDGILDLVYVKKYGTGSGQTEVHALDGRTGYQSFLLHKATALHATGAEADFRYVVVNGELSLCYVKKSATPTGKIELHFLRLDYDTFLLHIATALNS